jgi:hypothetical protein
METADYWVQQKGTVANGKWEVICHFGEPGQHTGKPYEFLAVANPQESLIDSGGKPKVLKDWPKSQYRSQLVRKVTWK